MSRSDFAQTQGEEAGAVVRTTVASHDETSLLTELRFAGGRIWVAQQTQRLGTSLRLRILAKDVSLALTHPTDTSILNILAVRIVELTDDAPGQVLVRLDAAGVEFLARITRRSASQLHLRPGLACFAQIKSVALLA
jgi:molybdate transport system ATP-binding protein